MTNVNTALLGITRLNSSVNGNPRFVLHTMAGDFTTSSDASCNYDVENIDRERSRANLGALVTLELTRAGRVSHIKRGWV